MYNENDELTVMCYSEYIYCVPVGKVNDIFNVSLSAFIFFLTPAIIHKSIKHCPDAVSMLVQIH